MIWKEKKARTRLLTLTLVVLYLLNVLPITVAAAESPAVTQATAEQAVAKVINSSAGVTASNISFTGNPAQLGIFTAPEGSLPIADGIAISTGNVADIFGSSSSDSMSGGSNADLGSMAGYTTSDAAVLEFEVTPTGYELSFQFFFASREYDQSINYNDIFALWIYDPAIGLEKDKSFTSATGATENGLYHYNTARLPDGNIVTITNSRGGGPDKYTANTMPYATKISSNTLNGIPFGYIGYTGLLGADASDLYDSYGQKLVRPGRTLRIRMAIADVSDSSYNSTVFIKANSVQFTRPGAPVVEADAGENIINVDIPDGQGGSTLYIIPKDEYNKLLDEIAEAIRGGEVRDPVPTIDELAALYQKIVDETSPGETPRTKKIENFNPQEDNSIDVSDIKLNEYYIVAVSDDGQVSDPTYYNKEKKYEIRRYFSDGNGGYTLVTESMSSTAGVTVSLPPYSGTGYTPCDAPTGLHNISSILLTDDDTPQYLVQYYEPVIVAGVPSVGTITAPVWTHGDTDVDLTMPSVTDNGAVITGQGWKISSNGEDWDVLTVPIEFVNRSELNNKKLCYYVTYNGTELHSNVVTITVNKANTTLAFTTPAPSAVTYTPGMTYSNAAGSASTGTVSYAITGGTGAASINTATGQINNVTAAGTIVVTATQLSDNNYNAPSPVSYTLTVNKADQAQLTVAGLDEVYNRGVFPFDVTAGTSGGTVNGAVTYSSNDTNTATVAGNVLTIKKRGSFKVTATMAGNALYNPVSSAAFNITVNDVDAPTGTIEIGSHSWNSFWNTVTFGLFCKETKLVSINAADNSGEAVTIAYYLSTTELTGEEAESLTGWITGDSVSINPNSKYIVYAKLTDTSGNFSIINSTGVVIYTDSEQDTESISFTKTSTNDVTAEVILNDNTIDEIMNGGNALVLGTHYTVSGSTVTFKASYLDTLASGDYTLTVSYRPMGVEYPETPLTGSETPDTTTIVLKVKPQGNKENKVEIKNADTPQAKVEGLKDLFKDSRIYTVSDDTIVADGGIVEIKLIMEKQDEPVDASLIINAASEQIIGIYLDLSVLKSQFDENGNLLEKVLLSNLENNLLTITFALPNELKGKDNLTLYRVHNGKAEILMAAPNEDGESCVISDDIVTLTVCKFSTYAIGYTQNHNTNEETPNTGDTTPFTIYTIIFLSSATILLVSVMKKKRIYIR